MRIDDRLMRTVCRCVVVLSLIAFARSAAGQELLAEEPGAIEIDSLVEQLGSGEFAVRERAASDLLTIGLDVVPQLRLLIDQTGDAEVRLRAEQVVRQLTDGDMQSRIDEFLAGHEVGFEGWEVFRSMLGDNGSIRDLFVELLKSHPELIASLEGNTRDRVVALEKTITTVQQRTFVERILPTRADTFALVLPTVDPNVPVTAGYESVLLSTLQKEAASKIREDARLAPPMEALLGRVVIRSTLDSRIDMLLAGMEWDINDTLPLAIATLSEANQTETLATAFQAIAKFGSQTDADLVKPFLNDSRPASETGFAGGKQVRAELRDIAMATIGLLYDADLAQLGFGNVAPHPTYGFILDDIGFPIDDPAPRNLVREKIDRLLAGTSDSEGS